MGIKKMLSVALFCGVLSMSSALALAATTDTGDSKEIDLVKEVAVSTSYEVSAATSESEYTYEIDADTGNATITGYIGTATDLVIPSVIDGHKVTKIDDYVFAQKDITSVVLPSTIMEVGEKAFYKCDALKSVEFNEGTEGLVIGGYAFTETNISDVILPSTIIEIGERAFYKCDALKSVEFNKGTNDAIIGKYAFYWTEIESVTIPGNYKEIGERAFASCFDLKSVVYEASSGSVADQKISYKAFNLCSALRSVTLTSSIKEIDEEAFADEYNVSFYGNVGEYVENYAKEHDIDCVTGSGVTESGYSYNISFGNAVITGYTGEDIKVTIPSEVDGYEVKKIGAAAFRDNTTIEHLIISEGIEVIGNNAFFSSEVVYLELPSTIRKIGYFAFGYCVKELTLKKGEADAIIGDYAFDGSYVKTVTIPANYAVVGYRAFAYCKNLTTAIFESDGEVREGQAVTGRTFYGCTALKTVVMPSTIKNIETLSEYDPVFYNCSSVTVYGHEGSAVQEHAIKYSIPFVAYKSVLSGVLPVTVLGSTVTLDASESTGYGELKYQYLMHNKDTDKWTAVTGTSSSYTWVANVVGNVEFFVKVKDETGSVTTSSALATNIKSELAKLEFTASCDKTDVIVGEKVKITADVTSGEAPYTYSYIMHNKKTDAWYKYYDGEFVEHNYIIRENIAAGCYEFFVKVKDASGRIVTSEAINIDIYEPITGEFTVNDKTTGHTLTAGDNVVLKADAMEGGSGDYTYKFVMYDKLTGKWSTLRDYEKGNTCEYKIETAGDKTFKVHVKDGKGNETSLKNIYVKVAESLNAKLILDTSLFEEGESVKISVDATGGYGPYKYTYLVYDKENSKWSTIKSNSTSNEYIWQATSAGTKVFHVDVYDSTGARVRCKSGQVTCVEPLLVSAAASMKTSFVGDKVKFTVEATGGCGSYKYSYIVYNKTTGKWARLKDKITSNTYTWTAGSEGIRVFYVEVTDSNGNTVRSEGVTVTTTPKLLISATASIKTTVVGDKVKFAATATGGSGSYKYSYIVYNKTTGKWARLKDEILSNTYTWTAKSEGTRVFYVEVTDSNGKTVRSEGITVTTKENVPEVVLTATKSSVSAGASIKLTATATEGKAPYTYSFLVYNCTTKKWYRFNEGEFLESNTKTWKASGTGKRKFFVEVTDSNGKTVRSEGITITIK